MKKKIFVATLAGVMLVSATVFGGQYETATETATVQGETASGSGANLKGRTSNLDKIQNNVWKYNSVDKVYYQLGISYCAKPADPSFETLAIFVPSAYMNATSNGDGTYSCEINPTGKVGAYMPETAPIVMPIETPGYSAMAPLTDYASVAEYTNEGFVYVHAGCRGRDEGAPAGATDLKAVVRYLRYSAETVPGNAERIFTFGMSGGGAQSALMGATGDSALYFPYLEQIGAVMETSDAVFGSMCWCPITNLDTADEAYEWMMGATRQGLSDEERRISDALAKDFVAYVNSAGIKDEDGAVLTLSQSGDSGGYYDYLKKVVERSLNNFLADVVFPYDASAAASGGAFRGRRGFPGGGFPGGRPKGGFPRGGGPNGPGKPSGDVPYEERDDIVRNQGAGRLSLTGTYATAKDYVDAMNANGEWVVYDAASNTATISSLEDFVKAFKTASKNIGAFDQLDGGQGENTLFGYGDGKGAHFDARLATILNELGSDYASAYAEDLAKKDSVGNTVKTRLEAYTPLYYLLESEEGYRTAVVAKHWRIRTGIAQGDCALSTETNLALALKNYDGVESVDFETVWGLGHVKAERKGSSDENFIAWVNEILK